MRATERLRKICVEVGGLMITPYRTLRTPYDTISELPAGLGTFPIYKVSDFKSGVPDNWQGEFYFMPMYRSEALWMNFGHRTHPTAVIVAAGAINAVTGRRMEKAVLEKDQNYIVTPPQPWIDGWKDESGTVYQFVAAELGSGETIERQLTGQEKIGGIQIAVFQPKDLKIFAQARQREHVYDSEDEEMYELVFAGGYLGAVPTLGGGSPVKSMGLGRGGRIRQKIYPDPHGFDTWRESPESSTCIYLVRSEDFKTITGEDPPHKPITEEDYRRHGIPWFELSDKDKGDTKGNLKFGVAKPVGTKDSDKPNGDVFQVLDSKSK